MNPELEALILALDAVIEARASVSPHYLHFCRGGRSWRE